MTTHALKMVQAQKRPEKTLSMYLQQIFGIETAYNSKKIYKNEKKKQPTLEKEDNEVSGITTLLDSNDQFSTTKKKKNHKAFKETATCD